MTPLDHRRLGLASFRAEVEALGVTERGDKLLGIHLWPSDGEVDAWFLTLSIEAKQPGVVFIFTTRSKLLLDETYAGCRERERVRDGIFAAAHAYKMGWRHAKRAVTA